MSLGALLIASFSDPEGLLPAAEVLDHSSIVECWSAVDGHIDIVAKLSGQPSELLEQLQQLQGIEETQAFDLSDESGLMVCDARTSHSFVFLDVERQKNAAICATLRKLEGIAFSSSTNDQNEIIAVVSGNNFQMIDRIVNDQIRTIDGVLRLKQDRVINLRQI